MVRKGSGAWLTVIVALLMFIVAAVVFTSVDPVMQMIFDSELWTSDTTQGQNALKWQKQIWSFATVAVLVAVLMQIWIGTRQPQ